MGIKEENLKTSIADSFTKTAWSSTGTIVSDAIIVYVTSSGYLSQLQDVDSSNRQNGFLIHWNAFTQKHEYFDPPSVIVSSPALVDPSTPDNFVSFLDAHGEQKDSGYKGSDFSLTSHLHTGVYAPASEGVTNGNSHDHVGGDGAAITENALSLSNTSTGNVTTTRHGFVPIAPNDSTEFLRGDGSWGKVTEGGLSLSNTSTGDVTTTRHGFVPIAPNNTSQFLRGDGTWNTPPVSPGDVVGPSSALDGDIPVFDGTTGKLIKDSGVSFSSIVSTPQIQMFYQNISINHTIPSGQNGLSVGPVTVDAGVTVTVSVGSVWTIV